MFSEIFSANRKVAVGIRTPLTIYYNNMKDCNMRVIYLLATREAFFTMRIFQVSFLRNKNTYFILQLGFIVLSNKCGNGFCFEVQMYENWTKFTQICSAMQTVLGVLKRKNKFCKDKFHKEFLSLRHVWQILQ